MRGRMRRAGSRMRFAERSVEIDFKIDGRVLQSYAATLAARTSCEQQAQSACFVCARGRGATSSGGTGVDKVSFVERDP
jgi:hypothetical protein